LEILLQELSGASQPLNPSESRVLGVPGACIGQNAVTRTPLGRKNMADADWLREWRGHALTRLIRCPGLYTHRTETRELAVADALFVEMEMQDAGCGASRVEMERTPRDREGRVFGLTRLFNAFQDAQIGCNARATFDGFIISRSYLKFRKIEVAWGT
tara:strand:+ start:4934 stop:5407 length:474 start_codon:yes stop_codon:yes gene_type:complete